MTELTLTRIADSTLSKLILRGDISSLSDTERVQYYHAICENLGLNPVTKPFDYLVLRGKQVLYLNKSGAEQLNKVHGVSMTVTDTKKIDDIYIVTARASVETRMTDSTGCVNVKGLYGDDLANAYMKAETKAKRRATISLLGLAMLDETEVETIPNATTRQASIEIVEQPDNEPPVNEPSMEDWEEIEKLVESNGYPIAYFRLWYERTRKYKSPIQVYQEALAKFSKPNIGVVEKDEVAV
jgi:hypothetical protein